MKIKVPSRLRYREDFVTKPLGKAAESKTPVPNKFVATGIEGMEPTPPRRHRPKSFDPQDLVISK